MGDHKTFKEIYVAQSCDGNVNFMFMVKASQGVETDRQTVMTTLKALEALKFEQVDQLWVPAFRVEAANDSASEVEGIEVGKDARVV